MSTDGGPIRVVVADDHWIVREGLRRYLGADQGFLIVGEASDGIDAVRLARTLQPNVVVMDLLMPGLDGVAAIEAIHNELPQVAVLALTSVHDEEMIVAAMRAGASGYVLKDSDGEELKQGIRAAAAGRVHLSQQAATHLLREIHAPPRPTDLTQREQEVLGLLGQGLSNKEIANLLNIGDGTVKAHVSNILAKLQVHGRTRAAVAALQLGLVKPDHQPRG
jgi:two-component system, NarL family, response regulator LiaR